MAKPASSAQIDLILKNGWATMTQCQGMTAGDAFKLIQSKLGEQGKPPVSPNPKSNYSPERSSGSVPLQSSSKDNMMMLSYAKDLAIAVISRPDVKGCFDLDNTIVLAVRALKAGMKEMEK
jgi:hypothetical protein